MTLEQAFGNILKQHRKKHQLSQEKLAELCSLDRTFVSELERGVKKPSLKTIFLISKSMNITASDFIREVEGLLNDNKITNNFNM